jgi:hypothetical protein
VGGKEMIIVAFADSGYKEIALNWAKHLEDLKIHNYVVYALDSGVYEFLQINNINTEQIIGSWFSSHPKWSKLSKALKIKWLRKNIDNILHKKGYKVNHQGCNWRARFEKIYNLLDEGVDILHSDIDAIWLKNPLDYISKKCDISASTGAFPEVIFNKLGFTLCMGWIFYKANNNVKNIFKFILDKYPSRFHDQEKFNEVLFENSLKSQINKTSNPYVRNIMAKNINIDILDQKLISRFEGKVNDVYVHHPVSSQGCNRISLFKELGLWKL